MLQAFLFDFNATLIRSKTWMELEVRGLPRRAFAYLTGYGYIAPLKSDQLARAEAVFKAERQAANRSYRETSHIDNLRMMVEALGFQRQVPPAVIEKTVAVLQQGCVPTVELIEGAADMLDQLQAQGYRLSIISNAAYSPFLGWTLEHVGLLHFFEQVVVSAEVGLRKPNPDIFQLTLDRMGLGPAETVYVGDDFVKDIAAAKKVGMRAMWYRPEAKADSSQDETLPDAIVTHLNQIPEWGERWREGSAG